MKQVDLSRIRSLVVDHDQEMQRLLTSMLRKLSCRHVITAADVDEAIEEMARLPGPDIVIADYAVPPTNGIELVRRIRTSPDSPNRYVPIILTGGAWTWAEIDEARNAGVNEVLVKPISPKAMSGRIHAVIHNPRPFLQIDGYFGPDRRRLAKDPPGQDRRKQKVPLIDAPLEVGVSREDPLESAASREGDPTQETINKHFDS